MLASEIINRVSEIYGDEDKETIVSASMISWLNDGLRALVLVRPDASTQTTSKLLDPGTRQQLNGTNDLRLLNVICNMGNAGTTPGRSVHYFDRIDMDAFDPDWHSAVTDTVVSGYTFDQETPHEFYVTPPVHATTPVYVRLVKSVSPATITAITDVVGIDDVYTPSIVEWMCYRAFSRDSEETPNWARAARHFASFFNLLQVKMQADMASSPKLLNQASSSPRQQ